MCTYTNRTLNKIQCASFIHTFFLRNFSLHGLYYKSDLFTPGYCFFIIYFCVCVSFTWSCNKCVKCRIVCGSRNIFIRSRKYTDLHPTQSRPWSQNTQTKVYAQTKYFELHPKVCLSFVWDRLILKYLGTAKFARHVCVQHIIHMYARYCCNLNSIRGLCSWLRTVGITLHFSICIFVYMCIYYIYDRMKAHALMQVLRVDWLVW